MRKIEVYVLIGGTNTLTPGGPVITSAGTVYSTLTSSYGVQATANGRTGILPAQPFQITQSFNSDSAYILNFTTLSTSNPIPVLLPADTEQLIALVDSTYAAHITSGSLLVLGTQTLMLGVVAVVDGETVLLTGSELVDIVTATQGLGDAIISGIGRGETDKGSGKGSASASMSEGADVAEQSTSTSGAGRGVGRWVGGEFGVWSSWDGGRVGFSILETFYCLRKKFMMTTNSKSSFQNRDIQCCEEGMPEISMLWPRRFNTSCSRPSAYHVNAHTHPPFCLTGLQILRHHPNLRKQPTLLHSLKIRPPQCRGRQQPSAYLVSRGRVFVAGDSDGCFSEQHAGEVVQTAVVAHATHNTLGVGRICDVGVRDGAPFDEFGGGLSV
jgi:hypothetical protein